MTKTIRITLYNAVNGVYNVPQGMCGFSTTELHKTSESLRESLSDRNKALFDDWVSHGSKGYLTLVDNRGQPASIVFTVEIDVEVTLTP